MLLLSLLILFTLPPFATIVAIVFSFPPSFLHSWTKRSYLRELPKVRACTHAYIETLCESVVFFLKAPPGTVGCFFIFKMRIEPRDVEPNNNNRIT